MFKSFLKSNSGATAIEYGLIVTLIAVVVVSLINFAHNTWVTHRARNEPAATEPHVPAPPK
ncbi:MAG: Flp family type IVb pilin [Candidatus Pacebacteria bacterium]|nr:Flp family type IVb pilin [Candidatus Paceibacterota bacterium]